MIGLFEDEYFFLSNFSPSVFELDGREYATVEHAFQAFKATNDIDHNWIADAKTPAEAKKRGRKIIMRKDWDDVKIGVMEKCLRKKFEDKHLRKKLLDTGDKELVEFNWWGDKFWGVCEDVGKNNLGKLLMKLRGEIKHWVEYGTGLEYYLYEKPAEVWEKKNGKWEEYNRLDVPQLADEEKEFRVAIALDGGIEFQFVLKPLSVKGWENGNEYVTVFEMDEYGLGMYCLDELRDVFEKIAKKGRRTNIFDVVDILEDCGIHREFEGENEHLLNEWKERYAKYVK